MAGKSQLCEPQEPPQEHHHLYCIPCTVIKFLTMAWSYVDSKMSLQKEYVGGRIRVHYTMVTIQFFWFPGQFVAAIQIQRWIFKSDMSIPKNKTYLRHLWTPHACPQSDTVLSITSWVSETVFLSTFVPTWCLLKSGKIKTQHIELGGVFPSSIKAVGTGLWDSLDNMKTANIHKSA